jgi:hypothetical protein
MSGQKNDARTPRSKPVLTYLPEAGFPPAPASGKMKSRSGHTASRRRSFVRCGRLAGLGIALAHDAAVSLDCGAAEHGHARAPGLVAATAGTGPPAHTDRRTLAADMTISLTLYEVAEGALPGQGFVGKGAGRRRWCSCNPRAAHSAFFLHPSSFPGHSTLSQSSNVRWVCCWRGAGSPFGGLLLLFQPLGSLRMEIVRLQRPTTLRIRADTS